MDRHLNVFLPYERSPEHEDQLTRAAMIVMRALPLARDALLARIGAYPSARLPEPDVDMQTRDVVNPLALEGIDSSSVHELISVFLSPDVGLDLSGAKIQERVGEQRLDGVVRFGDELVVVIESKVAGHAPSEQAKRLRLHGVEVEESRVVALGWHELLEDWWALLEHGLLAPAERVLMEDLIALTEQHFANLLPFTTLRRAGENDLRRQRRLMALLREATGIDEVEPERPGAEPPRLGAVAMIDAIGAKSTQRISLFQQGETLALCTWPAELKPQAEALYLTERGRRLIDFIAGNPDWRARPNVHLAYRGARTMAQRLYLTCGLELAEYARRWSGDDFAEIRAHPHDEIQGELWPWLRERQYAGPEDDDRLAPFLERLGRRDAHLRPGIEVRRFWPWKEAVDLDERGALAGEIRESVIELLTSLDEPLPPACANARSVVGHR